MIKLNEVVANAFIEKGIRGLDMSLTKRQLYNYANIISEALTNPVNISGGSLLDLKLNQYREFEFSDDENMISAPSNMKVIDYKTMYRDPMHLSTQKLRVYTSLNALMAIGIRLDEIDIRTR